MKNPVLENKVFINCLVCNKKIKDGYYGAWEGGGTCGRVCEKIQESKPKHPEHSEEQFLERFKDDL